LTNFKFLQYIYFCRFIL